MFISIVVPMLDAAAHLARSLPALLEQDYPRDEYEVLVVDNGSSDGSLEMARRWPAVRVLVEPARGSYRARNRGAAEARGDVIAFTDPDCEPDRDWLTTVAAAMTPGGADVILGRRRAGGGAWLLRAMVDYENTKDQWFLGSGRADIYYGYSSNMAVRRECFERFGPFAVLPRGADTLFVQEVVRARTCGAVRFVPQLAVTHLELDRLAVYCEKVFLYGRHRRRNNAILACRPLRLRERLQVFRRTVSLGGYGPVRSGALLATLGVGAAVWAVGAATAKVGHSGEATGAAARGMA